MKYTNIFGDSELSGFSPDGLGDYYKITDAQLDHNYWQEKIVSALQCISNAHTTDCQIIYGGDVTDGGSGTVDISAGMALGKDSAGNIRLVTVPALTGISLPSGWNDDRQIWVIGQYESSLDTPTRIHKLATPDTYHYILEDNYTGNADSDDLFVDSDPNTVSDTIVCWGSFKMNGTTFSAESGRTDSMGIEISGKTNLVGDVYVKTQNDFNTIIDRVSANVYKISDDITSLVLNNVAGGYQVSGILSGGDTYGYIQTNNCKTIEFKGGAYLDFENARGYIDVNTDDCYLRNVEVKGTGTVASDIYRSFFLNAYRVTYDNCKCSSRLSNVDMIGFQGSGTVLHNITSKYINCIAYDLDGSDKVYGFKDCMNLDNCIGYDLDSSLGTDACYSFSDCGNLSSCYGYQIDSDSGAAYGFHSCSRVSASYASQINSGGNVHGFSECNQISACKVKDIESVSLSAYGFYGCSQLSACNAEDIDSVGGTAYGFYGCSYGSALYTTEANNASNDWIDTVDAQVTNKVSTPSVWT